MRKLTVVVVALMLIALPIVAMAAVSGGDHDLTGTGEKLCFACHIPHNALGDNLWASTPSGTFTGVQDLCYTCHDGTVATSGQTTAFNSTLEQHATVGSDCSGAGACHDVHTQNPNTSGKFLVVTETNNSYCVTCHDATPFAGAAGLGDHTAGITHFTSGAFTCNQCHTAHGAIAQTTPPAGITNPILLADNQPGAYDGAFCISCHNGTAPTGGTVGSGGTAATDVFDYAMATNDGSEAMHPTISTTGATPVGGCSKCHDVHDPAGTPTGYILMADNTDSAYCISCHGAAGAPAVGANTHYIGLPSDVNMNSGAVPALPWANQIDEDGTIGADWATATANSMSCETCHSVHRQGYALAPSYFLRDDNTNNEICSACHVAN